MSGIQGFKPWNDLTAQVIADAAKLRDIAGYRFESKIGKGPYIYFKLRGAAEDISAGKKAKEILDPIVKKAVSRFPLRYSFQVTNSGHDLSVDITFVF